VITLRAFFEQARAGVLTAIRCEQCGALAMPPREACAACQAHAWAVVVLSGRGTIASFTIVTEGRMVAPEERTVALEPPRDPSEPRRRAVAVVTLTEGVSMHGRLVDIPLEQIAVGLPVRFRPLVDAEHTAVAFGPV
jgi:uncharacterized OB-fold protein